MTYNLRIDNLNNFSAINNLDKSFIGTDDYLGIAYFWGHGVKHWLREFTPCQRQNVHKELLKSGFKAHNGWFEDCPEIEKIVIKHAIRYNKH
jgi:hypothetical protein